MQVFKIGATVDLGKKLRGIVLEVLISNNDNVQYKCSWWNGKTRVSEWLESFEVEEVLEGFAMRPSDKRSIGFKQGENGV